MFDKLDPTPEERREMDAQALREALTELRALPRAVLRSVSTRLTMSATTLANGGLPDEGQAVLQAARLLYVLAHEVLDPPVAICSRCSKRRKPPDVAELVNIDHCRCDP